jgi:hypothetical protein
MSSELAISILSSEGPLDGSALVVSVTLPSGHFAAQSGAVRQPSIQALASEDTDLDLGHVQPTGVLRGVVEMNPAQQRGRRTYTQHVVEALAKVCVQVVQYTRWTRLAAA